MINKDSLFTYLDSIYPNSHCELVYKKDYELLIAVMLSAQTTDKSVNKATAVLFSKYPTLNDLANADIKDVENIIKFLGMYKNKAKNVVEISKELVEKYNSKVPNDPDILVSFPGVGNKTKNCVLAELYNEPLLAIDTHMQRLSKRFGIAKDSDDVKVIEKKMMKFIPTDRVVKTNHQLIEFGRYICKAISPNCNECGLASICPYKNKLR